MSFNKKIVFVGPPNSGKTTVFNWMTGYKSRTVNYPGSTVSILTGKVQKKYGTNYSLIDTPGIYSLSSQSMDEEITLGLLKSEKNIAGVMLVIDVTKIKIQLPLFFPIKSFRFFLYRLFLP